MERYPDIEIYLAKTPIETIGAWLSTRLKAPPLQPVGKRKWHTTGQLSGQRIPVLLVENVADGYASLWFDSANTPWARDADCAREASQALACEVRCSLGGWQPGDDPDRFWRILPNGNESAVSWPDSGG